MGVKIKKVKTLEEVKTIHTFVSEQLKISIRAGEFEDFPMVETYNEMVDTLQGKKNLQFTAEISGVLVGYGLAVCDKKRNSAWIRVIVVKKYFQKKGIARKLLRVIEKNVKKLGFDILKTPEREGANGFFTRAGYIPYLYVNCKTTEDAEKVKAFNAGRLNLLSEENNEPFHTLKFDVEEEAVYADKKNFSNLSKTIFPFFVYEKKLK